MSPSLLTRSALALCACAALALAACGQQPGSHAAPVAKPSASPATRGHVAASTPSPGATPKAGSGASTGPVTAKPPPGSQPVVAGTYLSAVQVDAQKILAASAARTTTCATRDTAGCRTAFQQVATLAATFKRDLDRNPAPACLKPVDASIRSAIGLYAQGAQAGATGQVAQGGGLLDQATARLTTVTAQIRSTSCSGNAPSVAP